MTAPRRGFSPRMSRTARSAKRGQAEQRGRMPLPKWKGRHETPSTEGGAPGHLPRLEGGDQLIVLVDVGCPPVPNTLEANGRGRCRQRNPRQGQTSPGTCPTRTHCIGRGRSAPPCRGASTAKGRSTPSLHAPPRRPSPNPTKADSRRCLLERRRLCPAGERARADGSARPASGVRRSTGLVCVRRGGRRLAAVQVVVRRAPVLLGARV
jgi:hypothetical protein